ncbi:Thyroid receptor-interacting protein 11 [Schistosoma japonicum]|nr:Thyroid receptor-interacting protein 11 [Schistosoma japonicum]
MGLATSYKLPKSWGGIAITLFWHAFCLICIIAYVMGTSELIFEQYTNDELKYRPYLNSQNETIYCNLHPKVCKYFEKKFSYPMEILNGKILASEINTSMILLTDHIHGQYLQSGKHRKNGWNYVKLACNTEDVEEDDDNGRVKANERFQDIPLTEMGFLTFNQKSLWGMNAYLKYLEESGKIYNIHFHKEKVFDFATKTQVYETLCITNEDQNIPIRLKQMNGPLLFMIIGGFSAIITHISEHIYYIVMNR